MKKSSTLWRLIPNIHRIYFPKKLKKWKSKLRFLIYFYKIIFLFLSREKVLIRTLRTTEISSVPFLRTHGQFLIISYVFFCISHHFVGKTFSVYLSSREDFVRNIFKDRKSVLSQNFATKQITLRKKPALFPNFLNSAYLASFFLNYVNFCHFI